MTPIAISTPVTCRAYVGTAPPSNRSWEDARLMSVQERVSARPLSSEEPEPARASSTTRVDLTRRELGIAAVGACLLAIVMTWPLVLHLGTDIPRDIGDPLAEAWQPAWGGHALLHQPLHFFDANRFWPLEKSLAFGDALIGYAPAGLVGSGPHDPVVRSDRLFLL